MKVTNLKYIIFPFLIFIVSIKGYSQHIMIGSGLNNERLVIEANQDTIFNKVVTSQDDRDVFISIPIPKKSNRYDFYIEDERVSGIYIEKKKLKSKTLIYIDFNRTKYNEKRYLLSVDFKIMSKSVLDR